MKKGTLLCWILGHKFFPRYAGSWIYGQGPSDYCGRCGLSKEEILNPIT